MLRDPQAVHKKTYFLSPFAQQDRGGPEIKIQTILCKWVQGWFRLLFPKKSYLRKYFLWLKFSQYWLDNAKGVVSG